jgi:hypothetical protein
MSTKECPESEKGARGLTEITLETFLLGDAVEADQRGASDGV